MINKLQDTSAERAVLSSIFSKGKDAFIEASSFLDGEEDFYNSTNSALYRIFREIDTEGVEDFGYENIQRCGKKLGLNKTVEDREFIKYLSVLDTSPPEISSLKKFCHNIKKWKACRELKSSCASINNYIDKDVKDSTHISEVIEKAESYINDYIDGVVSDQETSLLLDDLHNVIEEGIISEHVIQMGIKMGYPIWEKLIGGGPRPGGTSFIMARPKVGKSTDALNKTYNAAKNGTPVLYLDSELIKQAVRSKIICIDSGIPINAWESTSFNQTKEYIDAARNTANNIKDLPIHYLNIAGKDIGTIISLCRRWVTKHVGFNEYGKANNCVIVYDYFKLTGDEEGSGQMQEWLKLGLMLTSLNAFLTKYEIPLLSYGQQNRAGIDSDDGASIAGSDRILWFCNDFSVLRNKTQEDLAQGADWIDGNKKIKIIETRYGPGMPYEHDYINLHAKIRPNCHPDQATGKILEGKLNSELMNNKI